MKVIFFPSYLANSCFVDRESVSLVLTVTHVEVRVTRWFLSVVYSVLYQSFLNSVTNECATQLGVSFSSTTVNITGAVQQTLFTHC
jgi:hypothetical protein